jgi:hypothetical protein
VKALGYYALAFEARSSWNIAVRGDGAIDALGNAATGELGR